jgi:hypothetical protein
MLLGLDALARVQKSFDTLASQSDSTVRRSRIGVRCRLSCRFLGRTGFAMAERFVFRIFDAIFCLDWFVCSLFGKLVSRDLPKSDPALVWNHLVRTLYVSCSDLSFRANDPGEAWNRVTGGDCDGNLELDSYLANAFLVPFREAHFVMVVWIEIA